jgi:1,4-alpha-glucan branching enzyme
MSRAGALSFVLHSHIPYARAAGRWPHGEEWLHEAALETYIPILDTLFNLEQENASGRITLSLSPVLVEQLTDHDIQSNFIGYLNEKIQTAVQDVKRHHAEGNSELEGLARYYLETFQRTKSSFEDRYDGDIIAGFRRLQDAGRIEIATSAATHGYLPLLDRDESINLQLRTAVESYKRHFGRAPRVIWLPECAYRPAIISQDGRERAGLESFLARYSLRLFFAESHMIETSQVVGATSSKEKRFRRADERGRNPVKAPRRNGRLASTYSPYWVSTPEVAVLGRNERVGEQVWSAGSGYPGHGSYREFHKKDDYSGLHYWRVTGAEVGLGFKEYYRPQQAAIQVREHAAHFSQLVEGLLQERYEQSGDFGVIAANYDTELFGHWWYEGVCWLKDVLRRLSNSEWVEVSTAWSVLEQHPPNEIIRLTEGSWGEGGKHDVWDNDKTAWMWPLIHQAEGRMRCFIDGFDRMDEEMEALLNQAARELLLLQSSDWPFLITTGQAEDYAEGRFRQHLQRFENLMDAAERGEKAAGLVQELWEKDKIFPDMDYHWFQK